MVKLFVLIEYGLNFKWHKYNIIITQQYTSVVTL